MTPKQREAVDAVARFGSQRKAAHELGIHKSTLQERLRSAEKYQNADPAVKDAMLHVSTGIVPNGMWIKTKPTDDAPGYSLYLRPEVEDATCRILDAIKEGLADMPAAAIIAPPTYTDADLMTLYLIADAHFGMMAWGRETGEDWDTAKASERLRDWVRRCIASSPSSSRAVILDVGDTTHANDQTNQTPQSHHGLDVDTRFYKTMTTACEALGAATEAALAKHDHVTVVILPGNHNRDSYIGLRLGLFYRFRDNPRVTIYKSPGEFWVEQFGNAMVAAHHGDKAKAERIVMFLADQHHAIWGQTKHRFLWTGHLHHHKSADIGGVQWEQLRALTARDAYSVANAYSARAQLQAVTLHRTEGEVQRVKVNA